MPLVSGHIQCCFREFWKTQAGILHVSLEVLPGIVRVLLEVLSGVLQSVCMGIVCRLVKMFKGIRDTAHHYLNRWRGK